MLKFLVLLSTFQFFPWVNIMAYLLYLTIPFFNSQLDCFQTTSHCTFPSEYRCIHTKYIDVERYTCVYAHPHTSRTPQLCFLPLVFGPIASIYTEQVTALGGTVWGVWLWSLLSWRNTTWGPRGSPILPPGILSSPFWTVASWEEKLQKEHGSDSACSACTCWWCCAVFSDLRSRPSCGCFMGSVEFLLFPLLQLPSPTIALRWWMHHSFFFLHQIYFEVFF